MQEKPKSISIPSISPKKSLRKMESLVNLDLYSGLYKGLDSAILRQFIYCGMRLGIYKALEDKVKHQHNRNLTFG